MCIAIAKPVGQIIDDATLKICFDNNNDGAGFACKDENGKLFVYKTMVFSDFLTKYKEMDEKVRNTSPFIIHFRIRTHGTTDTFNCHPFVVNNEIAFIHNGIIRGMPDCPDKKRNDTQMYNELILKRLPKGWWKNEATQFLIEESIGASKFCMLNINDNDIWILNENKGEWSGGVWYSNGSYKATRYSTSTTYYGSSYKPKQYCKCCWTEVTYNIYALNIKENFCSKKCRKEYERNKELAETGKKYCEHCGISPPKQWYGYRFCSYDCEKKAKEGALTANTQHLPVTTTTTTSIKQEVSTPVDIASSRKLSKDEIYYELSSVANNDFTIDSNTGNVELKCCWCEEYHNHITINKVTFASAGGGKEDAEYICDTCLVDLSAFIAEYKAGTYRGN